MLKTTPLALLLLITNVYANDKEDISQMLNNFLANSHKKEAHQTFWAEDLIYTSSAGKRFGKTDILRSFEQNAEDEPQQPTATYSAQDVDIRLYKDSAVVAFKLVGKQTDQPSKYYFNTGTLLKRGDNWEVVAWQATKIQDTN